VWFISNNSITKEYSEKDCSKIATLVSRHFTESIDCNDGHAPFSKIKKSTTKVGLIGLSTMALENIWLAIGIIDS